MDYANQGGHVEIKDRLESAPRIAGWSIGESLAGGLVSQTDRWPQQSLSLGQKKGKEARRYFFQERNSKYCIAETFRQEFNFVAFVKAIFRLN